jgi:hypothetical protein
MRRYGVRSNPEWKNIRMAKNLHGGKISRVQ